MPLTLYHSPAGNGKTDFLIRDAINRVSTSPFGEGFFWVGPGPKYLDWIQKKIVAQSKAQGHFWGNSFVTFERFLLTLLKQNLPRIHTATKSLSRHILRQVLYHHPLWQKKSLFFKPVEQIRNTIITLKKNGLGCGDLLKIVPSKLKTEELKILCEVGEKYDQALHDLFFFDEGDLYKTTLDLLKNKKLILPSQLSDIFFDRLFPLFPGQREIIKYLKNNFPNLNLFITHSFDFKKQDDPYFYPAYSALGDLADPIKFIENKKNAPQTFSSSFENPDLEVKNIVLQIKKLLEEKIEPSEIALITPGSLYSEKIKKEFEKNNIAICIKTTLPLSIFKNDTDDNLSKTITLFEKNKNLKLDSTLKAQSTQFEFENEWNFESSLVFKNIPNDILLKWKNDEKNKISFINSESETGVPTLSLNEAFAQDFEHLFVCGFNESAYPQFSDENPFIPHELLTNPDLKEILWGPSYEVGLAKNILEQAVLRSKTTTFSYSYTNESGNPQYPSRFLLLFTCSPLPVPNSATSIISSPLSSQKLFPPAPLPDPISLTNLSDFNDCAFIYYCKNVLKLPRKEMDILGVAPDERGSFIHNILQYFYQQNPNLFEENIPTPVWKEKLIGLIDNEKLKTGLFSKTSQAIASDFIKKAELTITSFIENELTQFWNGTKKTKPTYFEWAFGKGKTPPLVIETENGKIAISGRIDRIDTDTGSTQFSVIDYKTGEIDSGASLKRGESLQVPLYIMAVQNLLLKNEEPSMGVLASLKEVGKKSALVFENSEEKKLASRQPVITPQEWENLQTQIKKNVGSIAKKIKEGNFNPNPRQNSLCRRCDYREICDYKNKG